MKSYAILDEEISKKNPIGYLICFEKANQYIVELRDDLDEWEAPLLFQKNVREGAFTISKDIARMWVEERVIPSGRQNIASILKHAKMSEYNEMSLLALSKGRCSQDNCYLEEIKYEDIPEHIRKRSEQNVSECFVTDDEHVICLFRDNLVRKVSLRKLEKHFAEVSHVLKHEALLHTVKVGVGGYSISFDDHIEIPVAALRDPQYEESVVASDFRNFIYHNILDTTRACQKMRCSRQNISYLVNVGKLEPITSATKENLFTKGSVERVLIE